MIVTTIFLVSVIFVVAVILIPIKIRFFVTIKGNEVILSLRLGLIYGLFTLIFTHEKRNYFKFIIGGLSILRKELKGKDKGKDKRNIWISRTGKFFKSAKEIPELHQPIFNMLSKVVKAIHVKEFKIIGKLGNADPYISGTFFGVYSALLGPFSPFFPQKMYIEPDFTGEFNVELSIELIVVQSLLIVPVLLLISKKAIKKTAKSIRGEKNET